MTLGQDGVYRWSYDMDMKNNLFMFKYVAKIILFIGFICDAIFLALVAGNGGQIEWIIWFALGITGGMELIWIIAYWIWGMIRKWQYRMSFEMNEDGIALIQPASTKKAGAAMASVVTLASLAAGRPFQGASLGASIYAGSRNGFIAFQSVRSMKEHRENDVIVLKGIVSGLQVWAGQSDYDSVTAFIREHTGDLTVTGSNAGGLRRALGYRLILSCAITAVIDLIWMAVNLSGYHSSGRLPLSWNGSGGDVEEWRAFGMYLTRYVPAEGEIEETFHWSVELGLGYFCVGVVAMFFILTAVGLIKRTVKRREAK
jgi:hypothetical protein